MSKHAFYLDTNLISNLAKPERTDESIRRRLALLVRCGAIEIMGSAEILEEFAGLARTDAEHFARSIRLFWTLVGNKVLVGRKSLLAQEIRKGSMLSRKEALLDADTIRWLQALPADDVDGWDEIATGVRGQGEEFSAGMHESGEKVHEAMLKTVTARQVRKDAGRFEVGEKTIRDWSHDVLRSNRETFGLSDDETKWPDVGQLPCTRALVSIMIALANKHHMARDHKYQPSDQHDMDHYASAATPGCLVTDDRRFRNTASLITWRSFPVIDEKEFLVRTSRM